MNTLLTIRIDTNEETLRQNIAAIERLPGVVKAEDTIERLTPQTRELLRVLAKYGPLSSAEAGKLARVPRGSARALLSTAVAVGAVERLSEGSAAGRERSPSIFALTERGRNFLREL